MTALAKKALCPQRAAGFVSVTFEAKPSWAAALVLLSTLLAGCGTPKNPPPPQEQLRHIEYTPPDIPLVRRKQVYREVQKLIHDFEEKTRQIREQFSEGKISAQEREELLKEARERYDFDLKAVLGRYGLRTKDLPNILAEARDKGWDQ